MTVAHSWQRVSGMLWAGRGEGAEVDGASLDPEGTKEPQIPFTSFFFFSCSSVSPSRRKRNEIRDEHQREESLTAARSAPARRLTLLRPIFNPPRLPPAGPPLSLPVSILFHSLSVLGVSPPSPRRSCPWRHGNIDLVTRTQTRELRLLSWF